MSQILNVLCERFLAWPPLSPGEYRERMPSIALSNAAQPT